MSERAPYSRVYWAVVDDPKFATIYDDDHHFSTWVRMLIAADALWPASCPIPANARKASVRALSDAGLIDVSGSRFRIHGLDAERGKRREAARTGTGRHPNGDRTGTEGVSVTGPKPSYTELHRDEPPRASATNGASARPRNTVASDPELAAQRAAVQARYGDGMDTPIPEPTKPLSAIEREREAHRHEANALHERFKRGDLTEDQYERLRADIGKEPDDLIRLDPHSEVSA